MNSFRLLISSAAVILCAALGSKVLSARLPVGSPHPIINNSDRIALSQVLPKLDGEHLKATVVEVTYGPGGSSPLHSHPCAVIVYVVHGALRSQVQGESEAVYKAGESFYEAPGGVHIVSANASKTEPARFVAYFICDHETPLSVRAPETKGPGEKQ